MKEKAFIYITLSILIIVIGIYAIRKSEQEVSLKILKNTNFHIKKEVLRSKRVWVKGKSLKECLRKDKEINNNTIKCRSGYYKEIKTK